jgi:hypothetical protein
VTPDHVEAAAAIGVVPTSVTVYFRHVYRPADGDPDPFRVRPHEGRWGTDWTLHTAETIHVAFAEYCRQAASADDDLERSDPTGGVGINAQNLQTLGSLEVSSPLPARALFRLTFRFERFADLTSNAAVQALAAAGFDSQNFYSDEYAECQALSRAGSAARWEALRAPSAAWRPDGRCVAVFEAGRRRLIRYRRVVAAARPTIAVAYATTYKDGERPTWLGSPTAAPAAF